MRSTILLFCCILFSVGINAQTTIIPYQGNIADTSGKAYNGTFTFRFDIVNSGGNITYWSSGNLSLEVTKGAYSVQLGSSGQPILSSSIFTNSNELYLKVSFDDAVHGMEALLPNIKILPVPYAVKATYADTALVQKGSNGDSLVLRDNAGKVRMVMNPNTGTFKMIDDDTIWYSMTVNSPPSTTFNWGNGIVSETKKSGNSSVTIYRDEKNGGKTIQTHTFTTNPDGSSTSTKTIYDKNGNVASTETQEAGGNTPGALQYEKKYYVNGMLVYHAKDSFPVTIIQRYDTASGKPTFREIRNYGPFLESYEFEVYDSTGKFVGKRNEYFRSGSAVWIDSSGRRTFIKPGEIIAQSPGYNVAVNEGKVEIKKKDSIYLRTFIGEGGYGGLWYGGCPSCTDTTKLEFGGGNSLRIEAPVLEIQPPSPTPENKKAELKPIELKFYGGANTFSSGFGSTLNGEITCTDTSSGKKASIVFDPRNERIYVTSVLQTVKPIKADSGIKTGGIYPISPGSSVTFPGSNTSTVLEIYESALRSKQKPGPNSSLINPWIYYPRWDSPNTFTITCQDSLGNYSSGLTFDPLNNGVTFPSYTNFARPLRADSGIRSTFVRPVSGPMVFFANSGIQVSGGKSVFTDTLTVAGVSSIFPNGMIRTPQLQIQNIYPTPPSSTVTINGNLNVIGNLSKGGGTFKVDHPLDPLNKYLIHSFVESPERINIYSGNITTNDSGIARVKLPDYFQASNIDFRYQLTVIGAMATAVVLKEIEGNDFVIKTSMPNIKVSWQVTALRNDSFAKQNPLNPEMDKEPEMQGKLLYPMK